MERMPPSPHAASVVVRPTTSHFSSNFIRVPATLAKSVQFRFNPGRHPGARRAGDG